MRTSLSLLGSTLLLLLGCLSACPQVEEPPPEPSTPPLDPSQLPCDPPLSLTPTSASVNTLSLNQLIAEGGTESYLFEQLENNSGGILNPLTGSYLTGPTEGVTDFFVSRTRSVSARL